MTKENYYHYTTVEGLRGIIESKTIWATAIEFLNDPSEDIYFYEVINKVCHEDFQLRSIYDTLYNQSYKSTFYDSTSKYIISMSNKKDSLPMWNYYAKGNGYCIEFNKNQLFNISDPFFSTREVKVLYNLRKQKRTLETIIRKYKNEADQFKSNSPMLERLQREGKNKELFDEIGFSQNFDIGNFMNELFENSNAYKHPAYREEREVRIISELVDGFNYENNLEVKFRSTPTGQIVEYIEVPIHIENIQTIMLHPLISDDIHQIGLQRFLRKQGLGLTTVKKSEIPFRNV